MLTRVKLTNVRALRRAELVLSASSPTVLIGPNGAGKSTVLEVLDILRKVADGTRLEDALNDRNRDGIERLRTASADAPLRVELSFEPGGESVADAGLVDYSFAIAPKGFGFAVTHELLTVQKGRDSKQDMALRRGADGTVTLLNARTGASEERPAPGGESSLAVLSFQGEDYPTLNDLREWLLGVCPYTGFYVTPTWHRIGEESTVSMRNAATVKPNSVLDRRGLNLVSVLYNMWESRGRAWELFETYLRDGLPFVRRIRFLPTGSGASTPMWEHVAFPEALFTWHQLSEGAVSYICSLAALFQPNPDSRTGRGETPLSVLCFDEPEAHLHPSLQRTLVAAMERAVQELHRPILVATHSDHILDALSDPFEGVRVAELGPDGTATFSRFKPDAKDAFDEWRERYSLSEMRTMGMLDQRALDAD